MLDSLDLFFNKIFQLTLFFLLSIVLVKISKENILPWLYEDLLKKKRYWGEFFEKKKLFEILKLNAEREIVDQNLKLAALENKIDKWHNFILNKNEKIQQYKNEIIVEIETKKVSQQDFFCAAKLQSEVLPKAVKEAHFELSQKYRGESGSVLLKALFNRLNKF